MKKTEKQVNSSQAEHLKPWQFQPGQSGNPGGRPKGAVSLKTFAEKYLRELPDEEKIEFMAGLPKDIIWKMAEGNPKTDLGIEGELTVKKVLIADGNRGD